MRLAIIALAIGTASVAEGQASAQTLSTGSEMAWAGEARYWADQEAGNNADYIKLFDENFMGWPCERPSPARKADVNGLFNGLQPGVMIDRKSSVTGPGFVITYYRATGRIQLGGGRIETLVLNFTHTWIPTVDGWKITGGMCRPAPNE